jgi:hypothetical protein
MEENDMFHQNREGSCRGIGGDRKGFSAHTKCMGGEMK